MEARKIIITGGATRIGAAIAKKLSGTKKEILRNDGSKIQFDTNAVVILDNKLEQSFISFKNNYPKQDYNIPRNMAVIDEDSYLDDSYDLDELEQNNLTI